jgi:hypothetical protein
MWVLQLYYKREHELSLFTLKENPTPFFSIFSNAQKNLNCPKGTDQDQKYLIKENYKRTGVNQYPKSFIIPNQNKRVLITRPK